MPSASSAAHPLCTDIYLSQNYSWLCSDKFGYPNCLHIPSVTWDIQNPPFMMLSWHPKPHSIMHMWQTTLWLLQWWIGLACICVFAHSACSSDWHTKWRLVWGWSGCNVVCRVQKPCIYSWCCVKSITAGENNMEGLLDYSKIISKASICTCSNTDGKHGGVWSLGDGRWGGIYGVGWWKMGWPESLHYI